MGQPTSNSGQLESQADPQRREFLTLGATVATTAMAGGLAASYGTFVWYAGRYLYPAQENSAWMFVVETARLAPGEAMSFRSPTGVPVVITRKSDSSAEHEPTADDFLALSSVCPHLGCRVHWEAQNNRFFCPCHYGVFDPQGKATAGPPLAANQDLPEYPLEVKDGVLYIFMPIKPIDPTTYRIAAEARADGGLASRTPDARSDRGDMA